MSLTRPLILLSATNEIIKMALVRSNSNVFAMPPNKVINFQISSITHPPAPFVHPLIQRKFSYGEGQVWHPSDESVSPKMGSDPQGRTRVSTRCCPLTARCRPSPLPSPRQERGEGERRDSPSLPFVAFGQRMVVVDEAFQAVFEDVGVDFGGGNVGVAK